MESVDAVESGEAGIPEPRVALVSLWILGWVAWWAAASSLLMLSVSPVGLVPLNVSIVGSLLLVALFGVAFFPPHFRTVCRGRVFEWALLASWVVAVAAMLFASTWLGLILFLGSAGASVWLALLGLLNATRLPAGWYLCALVLVALMYVPAVFGTANDAGVLIKLSVVESGYRDAAEELMADFVPEVRDPRYVAEAAGAALDGRVIADDDGRPRFVSWVWAPGLLLMHDATAVVYDPHNLLHDEGEFWTMHRGSNKLSNCMHLRREFWVCTVY